MTDESSKDLLWRLADLPARHDAPAPGDGNDDADVAGEEMLQAYRLGRLEAADRERVERRLIRDPAARSRLLELAAVQSPALPRGGLTKILETVRTEAVSAETAATRAPARLLHFPVAALRRYPWAAAVAAILVAAVLLPLGRESGLPSDLRYDVRVRATALDRSTSGTPGDATGGVHVVDPESLVEIVAAPDTAHADLELGLYRPDGADRWRRLRTDSEVEQELFRGGAVFRAPARDLFGARSGAYRLLLVVAAAGDLPAHLRLAPGADPAQLESAGRRRVYPLDFELQPAPGSADPTPP